MLPHSTVTQSHTHILSPILFHYDSPQGIEHGPLRARGCALLVTHPVYDNVRLLSPDVHLHPLPLPSPLATPSLFSTV